MIKVLLCACCVTMCVAAAWLLTRKYRLRMSFYYNLNLFNERLVNEVSYTKQSLPTFLNKYSFTGDFGDLLSQASMDKFSDISCSFFYLDADERQYVRDYFSMIGKSDAQSQKTYLQSVGGEIAEKKKSADTQYRNYFSLYLKLGFLLGLALVVLLV